MRPSQLTRIVSRSLDYDRSAGKRKNCIFVGCGALDQALQKFIYLSVVSWVRLSYVCEIESACDEISGEPVNIFLIFPELKAILLSFISE